MEDFNCKCPLGLSKLHLRARGKKSDVFISRGPVTGECGQWVVISGAK